MHTSQSRYVVVGGGSAGCAAVHGLLSHGVEQVTLIEAGPDYGDYRHGRWPDELLDAGTVARSHDWGYATSYFGRLFTHSRARVIGGCSAHNEANVVWADPAVYDDWARELDDDSWRWEQLKHDIDEIENSTPSLLHHGTGGCLETQPYPESEFTGWTRGFLDASEAIGLPRLSDFSGPMAPGSAVWHRNTRERIRWNSAFAFLDRHRADPRLTVLSDLRITHLEWAGQRAVRLCGIRRGEPVDVEADVVLLASGAVGSPELLLRSGVGSADKLRHLGLGVQADVPGVGARLTEHTGIAPSFALSPAAEAVFAAELVAGRTSHCQVVAPVPVNDDAGGWLNVLPYEATYDGVTWSHMIAAFLVTPQSMGSVELATADPSIAPIVDAGCLSDPDGRDLGALRFGVEFIADLVARSKQVGHRVVRETTGTSELTGADLERYIRQNFITYSHLTSSCAMGSDRDPDAVTNTRGLVRGTENVFVVDASLIPRGFSAATNLTAMLLGYRLARQVAVSS